MTHMFWDPATVTAVFGNAIRHLCLKIRPKRFTCANPSCARRGQVRFTAAVRAASTVARKSRSNGS
jgi:hypothetical protein